MASVSEKTFGSRLLNAEKILTHLTAFTGYNPSTDEQSISNYETLIATIKVQNNEAASKIQAYSAAVDIRQKLFQKNSDSLNKIMTPIGAAIRSAFGKTSKEAADIASLVTKVRGISIKKDSKEPNADTVSQSERSYGSMTQTFADMIATLENYGASYNPANDIVKLPQLKDKLITLTSANTAVTVAYGALKEKRDDRSDLYKQLTDITQRIKDAVKSQYGNTSTEYVLIKGLKV
ncbi:MAG: hypothetical protein IPP48_06140 [Chitinophagaceae bacterium]|nr:hypothetical protein [Chitinophagaceae bacterium]